MDNPQKSVKLLSSSEELAEDILRDKSEMVALDRRRNSNREGIRALTKQTAKKSWITLGPILVKMPTDTAKEFLQSDQVVTETEINKLHSDLKIKVNKLRDLEFEDPVPGISLNPLSRDEMNAVQQIFGKSV
jgi:endo-1,4-beta-mannosidase